MSLSVAVSQFGPFPFNLTLPFKNLFPQGNQVHPREGGVVGYFGEEVLHRGAGEVGVVLQVAEGLGGKEVTSRVEVWGSWGGAMGESWS